VLEQVMRELPDREDVDEVEEQLERGDDALFAGRPRAAILIAAILCLRHRLPLARPLR
jgi:hypothetical protein